MAVNCKPRNYPAGFHTYHANLSKQELITLEKLLDENGDTANVRHGVLSPEEVAILESIGKQWREHWIRADRIAEYREDAIRGERETENLED